MLTEIEQQRSTECMHELYMDHRHNIASFRSGNLHITDRRLYSRYVNLCTAERAPACDSSCQTMYRLAQSKDSFPGTMVASFRSGKLDITDRRLNSRYVNLRTAARAPHAKARANYVQLAQSEDSFPVTEAQTKRKMSRTTTA